MFVTGKTYNVLVGNTVQLSSISFIGSEYVNIRQDVTWKSSKESVADVDSTGLVYCKREGSAKITVTTYNGKKASSIFKVKQNIQEIHTILRKKHIIVKQKQKRGAQ